MYVCPLSVITLAKRKLQIEFYFITYTKKKSQQKKTNSMQ